MVEEKRKRIKTLARKWLEEDLTQMKRMLEGMGFVGGDPTLLEEYKTLAAKCLSWKRLIKSMK